MIRLLQLFVDNLLPIILVAGAGFALRRTLKLDPRPLTRTAFHACLPALVFSLLVKSDIEVHEILRMMAFAASVIGCVGLISWIATRALRLDAMTTCAMVLASMFMNSGNYGLSLNKFAFGDAGLAQATIFFITSSLLNNSLGVYVATVGRLSPSQALLGLVRVPAVYAIPLAFLVRMARIELPLALWRPVELIAAAAVPMMLLILGMQMAGEDFRAPGRLVWLAAGFRLLASPLIALVLAPSFGLTGVGYKAGILESAMPSAVLSSIIALEFDAQPAFVSAVVLVTTLLSPLTLTPLLAILGP